MAWAEDKEGEGRTCRGGRLGQWQGGCLEALEVGDALLGAVASGRGKGEWRNLWSAICKWLQEPLPREVLTRSVCRKVGGGRGGGAAGGILMSFSTQLANPLVMQSKWRTM